MRNAIRGVVVAVLAASFAVPDLVSPARALTHPETMSARRAFASDARAARADLELPATHGMFSWTGGERSGIEYRFALDGSLTRWRAVPVSHDLDDGRRHYSSPLLLRRSSHVEWRATGNARAVALDYVNTIDGPLRRTIVPATAGATATEPDVVTRAEWGADESMVGRSGDCAKDFQPVEQMIVHHTVTSNSDPNPAATVRAIHHFHTQGRGWCDIGYNFLVAQNGQIFEGRWARTYARWETHDGEDRSDRIVTGAHASGFNAGSIGISLLGNLEEAPLRDRGRAALVRVLAWAADRHDLNPRGWHRYGGHTGLPRIAGHRDAGQTSCPGSFVYRDLPSIRRAVARRIGAGKAAATLTPERGNPATFGSDHPVRFRLESAEGTPLPAKTVTFYQRSAGSWQRLGKATTDPVGWAELTIRPRRNVMIAAHWPGDADGWGTDAALRQRVRPRVTLTPEGYLVESSPGVYEYPQGTTEVAFGGGVRPRHPGSKVTIETWKEVTGSVAQKLPDQQKALDGTSDYRALLMIPPEGGRFRLRTTIESHADHTRGRSLVVTVVVPPEVVPLP